MHALLIPSMGGLTTIEYMRVLRRVSNKINDFFQFGGFNFHIGAEPGGASGYCGGHSQAECGKNRPRAAGAHFSKKARHKAADQHIQFVKRVAF